MAAAWLDDALELLLVRVLSRDEKITKELFGFDRPLGTFSTRIKLAFLLGLISDDTRQDLETIRELRNELAHVRGRLSFTDVDVQRQCASLRVYTVFAQYSRRPSKAARQRFVISAYLLTTAFLSLADTATPFAVSDPVTPFIRELSRTGRLQRVLSMYGGGHAI